MIPHASTSLYREKTENSSLSLKLNKNCNCLTDVWDMQESSSTDVNFLHSHTYMQTFSFNAKTLPRVHRNTFHNLMPPAMLLRLRVTVETFSIIAISSLAGRRGQTLLCSAKKEAEEASHSSVDQEYYTIATVWFICRPLKFVQRMYKYLWMDWCNMHMQRSTNFFSILWTKVKRNNRNTTWTRLHLKYGQAVLKTC